MLKNNKGRGSMWSIKTVLGNDATTAEHPALSLTEKYTSLVCKLHFPLTERFN